MSTRCGDDRSDNDALQTQNLLAEMLGSSIGLRVGQRGFCQNKQAVPGTKRVYQCYHNMDKEQQQDRDRDSVRYRVLLRDLDETIETVLDRRRNSPTKLAPSTQWHS